MSNREPSFAELYPAAYDQHRARSTRLQQEIKGTKEARLAAAQWLEEQRRAQDARRRHFIGQVVTAAQLIGPALREVCPPEVELYPARKGIKWSSFYKLWLGAETLDRCVVPRGGTIAEGWPLREAYCREIFAHDETVFDGGGGCDKSPAKHSVSVPWQRAYLRQLIVTPQGKLLHCSGEPLEELGEATTRGMHEGKIGVRKPKVRAIGGQEIELATREPATYKDVWHTPPDNRSIPEHLLVSLVALATSYELTPEQLGLQPPAQ